VLAVQTLCLNWNVLLYDSNCTCKIFLKNACWLRYKAQRLPGLFDCATALMPSGFFHAEFHQKFNLKNETRNVLIAITSSHRKHSSHVLPSWRIIKVPPDAKLRRYPQNSLEFSDAGWSLFLVKSWTLIEGSGEAPGPSLSRLRKENTCGLALSEGKKKGFSVGPGSD